MAPVTLLSPPHRAEVTGQCSSRPSSWLGRWESELTLSCLHSKCSSPLSHPQVPFPPPLSHPQFPFLLHWAISRPHFLQLWQTLSKGVDILHNRECYLGMAGQGLGTQMSVKARQVAEVSKSGHTTLWIQVCSLQILNRNFLSSSKKYILSSPFWNRWYSWPCSQFSAFSIKIIFTLLLTQFKN